MNLKFFSGQLSYSTASTGKMRSTPSYSDIACFWIVKKSLHSSQLVGNLFLSLVTKTSYLKISGSEAEEGNRANKYRY